jgi:hypothetical protein
MHALKILKLNKKIMSRYLLLLITLMTLFSCKKENEPTVPPITPVPALLLKDIVIPNLPSAYYHFEYNAAGKPIFVSFASDLRRYDIEYSGDRISQMKNNIIVNKDILQYFYDNAGRVIAVTYADSTAIVYARIYFTYQASRLIKLERERKLEAGFIIDKTMTMLYHADGNLQEMKEHRPAMNGQNEITFSDVYEQYDGNINVDGFSLIHNEFFDHLVLLPGVQLQKNNPIKVTRSGDGVNYKINYIYTYNDKNFPINKKGELTFTNGPDSGKTFQINSMFTYY